MDTPTPPPGATRSGRKPKRAQSSGPGLGYGVSPRNLLKGSSNNNNKSDILPEWPAAEAGRSMGPAGNSFPFRPSPASTTWISETTKKGWLFKIGRHSFGGAWHKRFFILSGNTLVYYKNLPLKTESPVKAFTLGPRCRVEDTGRETHNGKYMYTFKVFFMNNTKPCQVGTRSPEDAAAWREAIQLVLEQEVAHLQREPSLNADDGLRVVTTKSQLDGEFTVSEDDQSPRPAIVTVASDDFGSASDRRDDEDLGEGRSRDSDDDRRASVGGGLPLEFDDIEEVLETMRDAGSIEMDERWRLIKLENGLRFFEEVNDAKLSSSIPCMKACGVVEAPCDAIFKLVMDLGKSRFEWDIAYEGGDTVEIVDGHTDVVHIKFRPIYLWPIWSSKRDVVMTRYWRRDPDGTYVILYRSTQHDFCPESPDYTRSSLLGGGWFISPLSPASGNKPALSLVIHLLELDPKGWLVHALGYPAAFQNVLLTRIAGIRELFAQTRTDAMTKMISQDMDVPVKTSMPNQIGGRKLAQPKEEGSLSRDPSQKDVRLCEGGRPKTPEINLYKGTLERGPSKGGINSWSEPDSRSFLVRGKTYLEDKHKIPAGRPALKLMAVDWVKSVNRIDHIASREKNLVQIAREKAIAEGNPSNIPFFFVVNMQVPAAQQYSMVFYYGAMEPLEPGSLLHRFVNGDDVFRNSRFKLIPNVTKGAWVVKRSVGTTPLIVGGALKVDYHQGPSYFEVDVDIGSSTVANGVVRFVLGYVRTLVIDMAFLVQSNTEEELPESLIGTVRLAHLEPNSAVDFDLDM